MTKLSTDDIAIPDEFAESLRRAATGLPGRPPNLADVHRRRRHRQMRRSVVTLAGVGVLVAASIVTPRLLTGSAAPVESTAPAVTASPTPPLAQRLLLTGQGWVVGVPSGTGWIGLPDPLDPSRPNYGFPPGSTGVVQLGPQEVTAAGEVVPLELPGEDRRGFHVFGDGRIVTLEWLSLSDTPRRDGPCVTDAALYLRLHAADGTMSLSRDVRIRCEETSIVGATDTEVFLIRIPHDEQTQTPTSGRRLVAHNLADGSERTIADLDALPVHPTSQDTNVEAGRVVMLADSYGCQAQTLDTDSGDVTTLDLTALVAGCRYVDQVRLSPDGSMLAVAYRTGPEDDDEEPYEAGFAVVDLADSSLHLREVVQSVPPTIMAAHVWGGASVGETFAGHRVFSSYYPAGIAWSDDSTVRMAWAWLPEGLDRVVGINEVLEVQSYAVP